MRAVQRGRPRRLQVVLLAIALHVSAVTGCGGQSDPKPRWTATTERDMFSDPAVAGGLLYVEAGDRIYALSTSDGTVRWREPIGAGNGSRPVVADHAVYVVGDRLFAFEAATGGPRWTWTFPAGVHGIGDPTAVGGLLYVAADQTNRIYVLDARTGGLRATFNVAIRSYFYKSALSVRAGRIFVEVWRDGRLYALDAATGVTVWSSATPGDHESDAVAADESLYVATDGGTVYAFDAATGSMRWQSQTQIQHPLVSNPAVADGVVYLASGDHHLYALSASSGARLWTAPLGDSAELSPAVGHGVVYVGADDGKVDALDARTGALRGFTRPGVLGGAPVFSDGAVYLGTVDGKVDAYDAGAFR